MKKFRTNIIKVSILLTLNLIFASCSNRIEESLDNSNGSSSSRVAKGLGVTSRLAQENTGEDLFKAVFFGYGDFARKIPSFSEVTKAIDAAPNEQHQKFNERFDKFAETVNKMHPEFFTNFRNEILSGDNKHIQDVISSGTEMIYENVDIILPELKPLLAEFEKDEQIKSLNNQEGEITQEDLDALNAKYARFMADNFEMEAACSWAVACVVYFVAGVHNTVGATVNIAAAVNVYWKVSLWGPKLDSYKKGKSVSFLENDNLKFEIFIQDIADASRN